jgi:hypothetical protein
VRVLKQASLTFPILVLILFSIYSVPTSYGVIQGHNPLVIQGHSPIVLLATDPNGFQIGCTAVPCTSTSSTNFVNTIPASEGPASYNFTTNTISVGDATFGTWTLKYIGTGATTATPFTITATSCPETNGDSGNKGHQEPGCPPADPDDKPVTVTLLSGTVQGTQTGSVVFLFNSDSSIGSIMVSSEFPLGTLLAGVAPIGAIGLYFGIRKRSAKLR